MPHRILFCSFVPFFALKSDVRSDQKGWTRRRHAAPRLPRTTKCASGTVRRDSIRQPSSRRHVSAASAVPGMRRQPSWQPHRRPQCAERAMHRDVETERKRCMKGRLCAVPYRRYGCIGAGMPVAAHGRPQCSRTARRTLRNRPPGRFVAGPHSRAAMPVWQLSYAYPYFQISASKYMNFSRNPHPRRQRNQ